MLSQTPNLLDQVIEVIGAVSVLATALSYLPFPPRAQAFLARLGIATSRFNVAKKAP